MVYPLHSEVFLVSFSPTKRLFYVACYSPFNMCLCHEDLCGEQKNQKDIKGNFTV